MWMGVVKPKITGKYSEKTLKYNNILKNKIILKPKYKPSGGSFIQFARQGGGSPFCPPAVTPQRV